MSDYQNIEYDCREGIAHLTIKRPEALNALNRATRREMLQVLEEVEQDVEIRVLVISGAGEKSFIAGSDVKELATYGPLEMEQFMATLAQGLYTRFEKLDKPVIAMIDGLCLGAGLELALACDIRVASRRSRLGLPEIRLGIIPGGGGTQRLPRLVGKGKAKELIFTGDLLGANEALELGIVNQVHPHEELEGRVWDLAGRIGAKSPLALKWAKRSINASAESGLDLGLAYEAMVECLLFASQDRTEGFEALLAKREPVFTGK
jgi:enoyl-CoA hydratase